jgi:Trm5-related predicted tRNA methylase
VRAQKYEVGDILNLQGLESGQRLGLRGTFFGLPSRWNRILSQWNKVYIIRSTIGRHGYDNILIESI